MIKHRRHGYRPRRGSSWWKVCSRTTADAVVGGVIGSLDAPEMLVLGLPDDRGRLRVAGRTGPLTLPARRELGGLLVPPHRAHPWPQRISSSRFGQLPPQPVDYTPTEPLVVVEVRRRHCFGRQRWRHATTYRRCAATGACRRGLTLPRPHRRLTRDRCRRVLPEDQRSEVDG